MNTADWSMFKPFGIDNGELDGLSPQQCFVLGVEWQMVAELCESGLSFQKTVHSINAERLKDVAIRYGVVAEFKWLNDDWTLMLGKPAEDGEA